MTLLAAEHLFKSYSGIHALTDVSFQLEPGEIHALVGENGAGKSTLIKILTGATRQDSGAVRFDGPTHGISVVYQEFTLIPHLSVVDNIFLGRERGGMFLDRETMNRKAAGLLEGLGVAVKPSAMVSTLSVAHQQMVEIARALASDAKVMILDEPTATLSTPEVDRLFQALRRLKAAGLGIIYISHRIDEIFSIADRITVLRDGRLIATSAASAISRSELIKLMVGRDVTEEFPERISNLGKTVFEMVDATAPPRVKSASLSVRAGEIVGLAGLVGSGRTSLALAAVGGRPDERPLGGTVRLDGKAVRFSSPSDALASGVAYITEDRKQFGLFPVMATAANMTLSCLQEFVKRGLLSRGREKAAAGHAADQFGIRAGSLNRAVMTLSGGNQQKTLLARFLMTPRRLVILDEPTRGVDVGARAEIYQLMNRLATQDLAVLLISSDLAEVIGMSDRVVVMRDGRTAGVLDRASCSPDRVLALAAGPAGPAGQ